MSTSNSLAMASVFLKIVVFVSCLLCLMADNIQPAEEASDPIMCVQCTPTDPRCESGNNIEPRECEGTHRFCAQYRVFMGNSQGIFRGCSRRWLQGCRRTSIQKPEDSMVCYHTCSWDGCNGGQLTSSLLH